jgi:hypothetical protein
MVLQPITLLVGADSSILPFIEQNTVYDCFNSENVDPDNNANWWSQRNVDTADGGEKNPTAIQLDALVCSSDGAFRTKTPTHTGCTNYQFCRGDNPFGWTTGNQSARGPFADYSYYSLSIINDGTSNTLMFSEHCLDDCDGATKKIKLTMTSFNNAADAGFIGSPSPHYYLNDRTVCANTAKGDEYDLSISVSASNYGMGWFWVGGHYYHVTFETVLPPNAPSCYNRGASYNSMITTSSYHPGGVNAVLLDSSGRFISETINSGTGTRFPSIPGLSAGSATGISPFGIWGALGSIDGSESVSF